MILLEVYFSKMMFGSALVCAAAAMLYTFGWQIVKDMRNNTELTSIDSSVTSKQVAGYFIAKGYVVCNITPVKNSRKWLAFLIKNGEYKIATVFTSDKEIEGHQDSLV